MTVVFVILLTAASLAWRQSIKRRRIHRDDGTSFIHWLKRVSVYTTAGIVLTISLVNTVSHVKLNNQTASSSEIGAGGNAQHVSVESNHKLDLEWIKFFH